MFKNPLTTLYRVRVARCRW